MCSSFICFAGINSCRLVARLATKFNKQIICNISNSIREKFTKNDQNDEIIKLLKKGLTLLAVKLQKDSTGMNLKESKEYVEKLAKDLNIG